MLTKDLWMYDETRDNTHTPRKKEPQPTNSPEDCLKPNAEPPDWNAADKEGNPPF